jgi:hypothetical protein
MAGEGASTKAIRRKTGYSRKLIEGFANGMAKDKAAVAPAITSP